MNSESASANKICLDRTVHKEQIVSNYFPDGHKLGRLTRELRRLQRQLGLEGPQKQPGGSQRAYEAADRAEEHTNLP